MAAGLLSALLLGPAAIGAAQAAEPFWADGAARPVAPEIARLNALLHDVAERVRPSLVEIRVTRTAAAGRRAAGSGFIVRPDGHVITNAHLVGPGERIQVRLADGRDLPGRLVGRDERSDLALIKVEASGLPAAAPGNSRALRVGELVLALGHPFGREHTVSMGIVSRAPAALDAPVAGLDFIQTDAAINPGNSGGPLVNMAGEVVGITTMAARNGSIGFAVPANVVRELLPQLAEHGRLAWGWLGVAVAEAEPGTATDGEADDLEAPRGVLVSRVLTGEPAERGGLRSRDLVRALDGRPLDTVRDFHRALASLRAGRVVTVEVIRAGRPLAITLTAGPYPDGLPARPSPLSAASLY